MLRRGPLHIMCVMAALAAVLIFAASASAARYGQRTMKIGSHGSDVKQLQHYLVDLSFSTSIDGVYGTETAGIVKQYERAHSQRADGKVTRAEARLIKADATGADGGSSAAQTQNSGDNAQISSDGRTAIAPSDAPQQVKDVIAAANKITDKPYRYGGGHGSFEDSGYDCSGSVSYALHGGGFVDQPLDSTGFESWGSSGNGQWITVYSNSGHAWAIIAGLRFDTSSDGASGESGPRWRPTSRSTSGYVARHPDGF